MERRSVGLEHHFDLVAEDPRVEAHRSNRQAVPAIGADFRCELVCF